MSHKKVNPEPSSNNAQPARERLSSSVLEELWSIWRTNARVPSIKSRRSWAISRNANPRLVDSWFLRRKTCAKKMGHPVPDESYDIPLGLPVAPKREPSATPIGELEATPDLPSDDTLVCPPDGSYLDSLEVSSDTIFDMEDVPVDFEKAWTAAYMEVPCHDEDQFQPEWRFEAILFSFADMYAPTHFPCVDSSFEDPFLVCNQGKGEQSDFTCVLCLTEPIKDEDRPDDAPATSDLSSLPNPYLDVFPEPLWELSAIPFLFFRPQFVEDSAHHQDVTDWLSVEEELERFANDGRLDFSFFGDPVSIELLAN